MNNTIEFTTMDGKKVSVQHETLYIDGLYNHRMDVYWKKFAEGFASTEPYEIILWEIKGTYHELFNPYPSMDAQYTLTIFPEDDGFFVGISWYNVYGNPSYNNVSCIISTEQVGLLTDYFEQPKKETRS